MIPRYPLSAEITMEMRSVLHPLFRGLKDGISEFTFANMYLFRDTHGYRISRIKDGPVVITGKDGEGTFFMLPFDLPDGTALGALFNDFDCLKNASVAQARSLVEAGYTVAEDPPNFDYIYVREELASMVGRRFHKKKNLVNAFLGRYLCTGKPLTDDLLGDAQKVLELWHKENAVNGDYHQAQEALEKANELQLCGGIYYIADTPVAYLLGEELREDTFLIHFEKGALGYKGLLQFVNHDFAAILPEKYRFINREQDLGDEGLRHSKMSYRPSGFIKKYRVTRGLVLSS